MKRLHQYHIGAMLFHILRRKKSGTQITACISSVVPIRSHSYLNSPGGIFFPVSYHLLNS